MLIPVAVLLFVSIRTRDIFKAVTAGLVSGIAVGLLSGTFGPSDILGVENGAATGFIYNGFTGMIGICLFWHGPVRRHGRTQRERHDGAYDSRHLQQPVCAHGPRG